ncbi:MAG: hypothetical protein A2Z97_08800 [Bdellovibrionales bacterium GWB1_52_6]|nr:MAG: hypothetical protein A2Z97_08800 [Bdellovibrionales bacterium GWB1_52_6]
MKKILSAEEIRFLEKSKNPSLTLWKFWSAKEAVYKLAKQSNPALVFTPSLIPIDPTGKAQIRTDVADGFLELNLCWDHNENYVHCLAAPADNALQEQFSAIRHKDELLRNEKTGLTPAELACVRSEESIAVRLLAKILLRDRGYAEAEVVRTRLPEELWSPPVVWLKGSEASHSLAVSLSHDGPWVAAVIAIARN